MKPVVCSVSWGKKDKDLHEYCIPSLRDDIEELGVEVRIYRTRHEFLEDAVNHECVFYTAPDNIWGKGSLVRLARMMDFHPEAAIAVPHFRINENAFSKILQKEHFPMSPGQLMKWGLTFPHENYYGTSIDLQRNWRYLGISSCRLSPTISVMHHSLPTIVIVKYTQSDKEFFKKHSYEMGQWDRGFLSKVFNERRLFIVGSSDVACMVELTEENTHRSLPPKGCTTSEYSVEGNETDTNKLCRMSFFTIKEDS